MFLVVAYDITDDRRRRRLVKLLKDYGHRVNYSVFECDIDKDKLYGMQKKIADIICKKQDSVLYYELCRRCQNRRKSTGIKRSVELEKIINI